MTTNRINHKHCDHALTPAARKACRQGRPQAESRSKLSAADMGLSMKSDDRRIIKIEWERVTCNRCAGSGQYPSSAWQGVCLKCSGKGQMLTRAGRAALNAWDEYMNEHHTKTMIDLEPGDVVRERGRRATVVSVDPEIRPGSTLRIGTEGSPNYTTMSSLVITVNFKNYTEITGPYVRVPVQPSGEALQAAFRHVAHRKGAIVTYAA